MKLSIIVPVYNVEKYVERCLNSLKGLDIENEIIVVNDGSTDNSLEVVEKFKKENPNENIIIINQKNQGVSVARNKGIEVSTGDYIYFLDSDDWIETEEFEKMLNIIENDKQNGDNADIYVCKEKLYNEVTKEIYLDDKIPMELKNKKIKGSEFLINSVKYKFWNVRVPRHIFRKKFLEDKNIYFPASRSTDEDEMFYIDTLYNANNVKILDYSISYYRLDRNGSLTSKLSIQHVENIFNNVKELILKYKDLPNGIEKKVIFYKIKRYYKNAMKKSIQCNRKDIFEKIYEQFKKDCKNYLLKIKFKKYENIELYIILFTRDLMFSLREKMKNKRINKN